MFLVRLVYVSKVSEYFTPDDIEDILKVAREKNQQNDVTGLLCFNRKYFLQCLEGSRTNINQTYHSILNDRRHTDIIMLDYKEVSEREFEVWSLGYMPESSLTNSINLKYSGSAEFEPYSMSGESAHLLMLSLSKHVPVLT